MSFFERAWHSAAHEYGRARAEQYGRWAKLGNALGVVLCVALALGIIFLWSNR